MHHPVVNKHGEIITSAVTNLDLHDIARACKTFGVQRFYVVTPLDDQKKLAERILRHWTEGHGAVYNPKRRIALEQILIKDSLADVLGDLQRQGHREHKTVATCARSIPGALSFEDLRAALRKGPPHVLLLGTAWGLAQEFISAADHVLEPIRGLSDYNHLSVRSAAAVMLDRLMHRPRE